MFNRLPASSGKKRGLFGAKNVTVSLVAHSLILMGAIYATVAAPAVAERTEEEVSFVEVEDKDPPKPETAPPPPPVDVPAVPPPPQGFQELIPPIDPPPVIPEIDTSIPAVDVADFTGIGEAGGVGNGATDGTGMPQNTAILPDSVFQVGALDYDDRPELSNSGQISSILGRYYPRILQQAGIEGEVTVQFVITSDGKVDPATVKIIQSSHQQFAEATLQAVERFNFRPGRFQGKPIAVLVQMPVAWQIDE
jgi:periplasmic protein TonB